MQPSRITAVKPGSLQQPLLWLPLQAPDPRQLVVR